MDQSVLTSNLVLALSHFVLIVSPPLLAAVGVGLLVGLLQAATQIQDQTLPQSFKLFAVITVFAVLAPLLSQPLIDHAEKIFTEFYRFSR